MNRYNVILGAGLTGLSVAWEMSNSKDKDSNVVIVEKGKNVGGVSNSFQYHGCTLDYGPHKFYTEIDSVLEFIHNLLGDEILKVEKKSAIYLNNHYYDYPFRMKEFIVGFNKNLAIKIITKYVLQKIKSIVSTKDIKNYEDAIIHRFGTGLYELIFKPQANKIWGNPVYLSSLLAEIRLPIPNLGKLILHMVVGSKDKIQNRKINVKHFLYPKSGISKLSEILLNEIIYKGSELLLNTTPIEIKIKNNRVQSIVIYKDNSKREIEVKNLISTIPINEMAHLISPKWDTTILSAADSLCYRSSILVYFLVKKKTVSNNHWIFFPENKFLFNRIYEQKLFSKDTIPYSDETIICLDFTVATDDSYWHMENKKLAEILISQLESCGLLTRRDVKDFFIKRLEKIYPIYTIGFNEKLNTVLAEENKIENLFTLGRLGLFNYSSMDQCIDMGIRIGKHILSGAPKHTFWEEEKNYFKRYCIVD